MKPQNSSGRFLSWHICYSGQQMDSGKIQEQGLYIVCFRGHYASEFIYSERSKIRENNYHYMGNFNDITPFTLGKLNDTCQPGKSTLHKYLLDFKFFSLRKHIPRKLCKGEWRQILLENSRKNPRVPGRESVMESSWFNEKGKFSWWSSEIT